MADQADDRPAEELAALRRVATLVARGVAAEDVFAAVTAEVGGVLGCDFTVMSRYDPDDTATVVAAWAPASTPVPGPIGTRLRLGEHNLHTLVARTHRPARLDSYGPDAGVAPAIALAAWVDSAVGAPIDVDGRLWGVMIAASRGVPLPADTEARLAAFTELVATAIANSQARVEVRGFAEEQAALRNVAILVAGGAPPEQVFAAVTAEAGRLLGIETLVHRFDPGDEVTVIAHWAANENTALIPAGSRFPLGGRNVPTQVLEAGRPARIDDYSQASGALADLARAYDVRSIVGVPITVEGRQWGVMVAATRDEPLPADTEARLAGFAELVATAIASAQARAELRGFAAEQAALRRVATLVARGVAAEEVFAAVAAECGRVLGCEFTVMSRYGPDDTATVVGQWTAPGSPVPLPVGQRFPLGGRNVHTLVARTHRAARLDGYGPDTGAVPAVARAAGLRSAVGVPIDSDGRLWGLMLAASWSAPLPADTEARLAGFTELVATAIANADARAALTASRARVVAAGDETRRRIERDLHDGIQQGLLSLVLQATAAGELRDDQADQMRAELAELRTGLRAAVDELRETARGIHPTILTEAGLGAALTWLARRCPVPVTLDVRIDGRLPEPVEVAAYYVVAEALTNALKHAQAAQIEVTVTPGEGVLHVRVRDDGRGGAELGSGSGLIGLTDRVEALGGRLVLRSPLGAGTTVVITLPLDPLGSR